MAYNVCLMGASMETGNRGVSALAASLIKNIRKIKPNADISLLIGNRTPKIRYLEISDQKIQVEVVNYRLSPRARIQEHLFSILLMAFLQRIVPFKSIRERIVQSNPWLQVLKKAKFVGDIHGGDSFSDIYGLSRFIIVAIPDIIALLMNKKLVLLPQTYGPYNHNIAKYIARFIMRHSYKVFSRDKEGTEIAMKMIGRNDSDNKVEFCPDVAFTLDSVKTNEPHIAPPISQNLNVPLIGFNVNGLMYNGGYTKDNMFGLKCDYKSFVHKLAERLLAETQAHLLFIPHTFGPTGNINSDPDACRDVLMSLANSYKNRIHMVLREYDQSEVKGIISLCDFFIGSRMHACIAALSQEIPTVGIAYSKKFKGVFESIGVGDMVVDARYLNTDTAVNRVLTSFQNRAKMKVSLQRKLALAKSQIRETFEEILSETH